MFGFIYLYKNIITDIISNKFLIKCEEKYISFKTLLIGLQSGRMIQAVFYIISRYVCFFIGE